MVCNMKGPTLSLSSRLATYSLLSTIVLASSLSEDGVGVRFMNPGKTVGSSPALGKEEAIGADNKDTLPYNIPATYRGESEEPAFSHMSQSLQSPYTLTTSGRANDVCHAVNMMANQPEASSWPADVTDLSTVVDNDQATLCPTIRPEHIFATADRSTDIASREERTTASPYTPETSTPASANVVFDNDHGDLARAIVVEGTTVHNFQQGFAVCATVHKSTDGNAVDAHDASELEKTVPVTTKTWKGVLLADSSGDIHGWTAADYGKCAWDGGTTREEKFSLEATIAEVLTTVDTEDIGKSVIETTLRGRVCMIPALDVGTRMSSKRSKEQTDLYESEGELDPGCATVESAAEPVPSVDLAREIDSANAAPPGAADELEPDGTSPFSPMCPVYTTTADLPADDIAATAVSNPGEQLNIVENSTQTRAIAFDEIRPDAAQPICRQTFTSEGDAALNVELLMKHDGNHELSSMLQISGNPTNETLHERGGLDVLVKEFNDWAGSLSFPVKKIQAGVVQGGLRIGVFATASLEPGETYLSVPPEMIMDADKAKAETELGIPLAALKSSLLPKGLWQDDKDSLRVFLIVEAAVRRRGVKDVPSDALAALVKIRDRMRYPHIARVCPVASIKEDRSKWSHYLRLLPSIAEMSRYHPLFFDDQTVYLLEGSHLKGAVERYRSSTVSEFRWKFVKDSSVGSEMKAAFGPNWITLERYLWATAILDSRVIWWEGRMHLVPLLDSTNCNQGPSGAAVHSTNLDSEANAVTKAGWRFEKGQQVFEDYGQPNHVLFLHHGFSLGRENRHDCVRVDGQPPPPGPTSQGIMKSLQETFPRGKPMFCLSSKQIRTDFIAYVRIRAGLSPAPRTSTISNVVGNSNSTSATNQFSNRNAGNGNSTATGSVLGAPLPEGDGRGWSSAINDPEGVEVVIEFLESRLGERRKISAAETAHDDLDSGGDEAGRRDGKLRSGDGHSEERATLGVEEAIRVFLDSERNILEQLRDHLATILRQGSSSPKAETDAVALNGSTIGSDIAAGAPKRMSGSEADTTALANSYWQDGAVAMIQRARFSDALPLEMCPADTSSYLAATSIDVETPGGCSAGAVSGTF